MKKKQKKKQKQEKTKHLKWALARVTDKKKRILLYIIYVHLWTNSEKICTILFFITYEQDVWWSYTHGNKPNMDRSVLTILVQLTAVAHFPSLLLFTSLCPLNFYPC